MQQLGLFCLEASVSHGTSSGTWSVSSSSQGCRPDDDMRRVQGLGLHAKGQEHMEESERDRSTFRICGGKGSGM